MNIIQNNYSTNVHFKYERELAGSGRERLTASGDYVNGAVTMPGRLPGRHRELSLREYSGKASLQFLNCKTGSLPGRVTMPTKATG